MQDRPRRGPGAADAPIDGMRPVVGFRRAGSGVLRPRSGLRSPGFRSGAIARESVASARRGSEQGLRRCRRRRGQARCAASETIESSGFESERVRTGPGVPGSGRLPSVFPGRDGHAEFGTAGDSTGVKSQRSIRFGQIPSWPEAAASVAYRQTPRGCATTRLSRRRSPPVGLPAPEGAAPGAVAPAAHDPGPGTLFRRAA